MKKLLLFPIILMLQQGLLGQLESNNYRNQNSRNQSQLLQKIDSVVNYSRVDGSEDYLPVDVFIYDFDSNEHYPAIERFSLPSREKVNKQNYFFDNYGRKSYYILQVWSGSDYVNRIRTDFYYDELGNLSREVYSGFGENGILLPYQQHWYSYDEKKRPVRYLRQMKNSNGDWYDFSYKNYLYSEEGRLLERNEQRIADNVIFWKEVFTHDISGRITTRIRQTMRFDPSSGKSVLTNLNKQVYSYDFLGELSGYDAGGWIDNNWVFGGRTIYYRSFIKGKKVEICHNGRTIVVSVNALAAHLQHGDVIGPCDCENEKRSKSIDDGSYYTGIVVYPNPFVGNITVFIPDSDEKLTDLIISNKGGTILLKEKLSDRDEISLDLSHLRSGTYNLTISGTKSRLTRIIIKK